MTVDVCASCGKPFSFLQRLTSTKFAEGIVVHHQCEPAYRVFAGAAKLAKNRFRLANLMEAHLIELAGPADIDQTVNQVGSVSRWIAMRGLHAACASDVHASVPQLMVGMVVALIAADHLSRIVGADRNECAILSCYSLSHELMGTIHKTCFMHALELHNALMVSQPQVLAEIGTTIAALSGDNDDKHLDHLGRLVADLLVKAKG
jgi:hypothetical protein